VREEGEGEGKGEKHLFGGLTREILLSSCVVPIHWKVQREYRLGRQARRGHWTLE
jgi:hypothetical protein